MFTGQQPKGKRVSDLETFCKAILLTVIVQLSNTSQSSTIALALPREIKFERPIQKNKTYLQVENSHS